MGSKLLPSGEVPHYMNSEEAIRVRQWATQILKEYITKGFVLNDERIKNSQAFGQNCFGELLERIQEIRVSERWAYQKIADIFEQCSCDYDKNSETTKAYYTAVWKNLLSEHGKTEDYRNQFIFSKMIDYAELTVKNSEFLYMRDWLNILNSYL